MSIEEQAVHVRSVQRVGRNTLWVIAGQALSMVISVPGTAYVARRLGSHWFGVYAAFLIAMSVFAVVGNLGLYDLVARDGARARATLGALLGRCIVVQTGFLPLLLLMSPLAAVLGPEASAGGLPYLAALLGYLTGLATSVEAAIVAHECLKYSVAAQVSAKVLAVVLEVAVLLLGYGLQGVIVGASVGAVVELVVAAALLFLKTPTRLCFTGGQPAYRYVMREGVQYWPQRTLAALRTNCDQIALSALGGATLIGWYKAARMPIDRLKLLPNALESSTYPVISRLGWDSPRVSRYAVEKFLKAMMVLALGTAIGITVLGRQIMLILFGAEYLPAVPSLVILAWSFALLVVSRPLQLFLNANGKQWLMTAARTASLISSLACALVLIPRYGLLGAAVASLVSELVPLVACLVGVVAYFFVPNVLSFVPAPLVASLLLAASLIATERFGLLVALPAGSLVYVGALRVTGGFDRVDQEVVRQALAGDTLKRLRGGMSGLWDRISG